MNRRDFNSILAGGLAASVVSPRWRELFQTDVRVNGDRLNAHLAALAEFGKNPQGGV